MSKNNIEEEYLAFNLKNEWSALYQTIRTETAKNSRPHTVTEALKPKNKAFNRYRDVSPYDHSRIILQRGSTDYINANLVKVQKANRSYILTQGPLYNTVSQFWLMVWEAGSKAVLMLNKLIENKVEKCYLYWPSKIGAEYIITLEDVGLTLEYIEHQDHSYYLTRVLRLTDIETKESRDIIQFHYTTWPDFGVPSSPTAFLEFLRKVRDAGVLKEDVGPAVIHCSAGIGRSGTFCLVDSYLVLIEKFGLHSVDVKDIIYEMRSYRMGLIQTPGQLRFSYQAIIEGAKQLDNLDVDLVENGLEISNGEGGIEEASESEDDGPPPLPPPRLDSLKHQNGGPERPLPSIPICVSMYDIDYGQGDSEHIRGPLPVMPNQDDEISEDDLEDEDETKSNCSEPSNLSDSLSPAELRHRKRMEQREKLEAKVKDMKRRQQVNEQWSQLKRSLYKPLFLAGTLVVGGGLIAYIYLKN